MFFYEPLYHQKATLSSLQRIFRAGRIISGAALHRDVAGDCNKIGNKLRDWPWLREQFAVA